MMGIILIQKELKLITAKKKDIIRQLFKIGAVKFGEFRLKSGLISPFYFDLRLIVSYPDLMDKIAIELCKQIKSLKFNLITGIPYTALPIATLVSSKLNIPLVYIRKEKKIYGTSQKIEGRYNTGETVLVIDDLITTGSSKVETIDGFESAGLKVTDISVAIDRSIDGSDFLAKNNVKLHSLITLDDIIKILLEDESISNSQVNQIIKFQSIQNKTIPSNKKIKNNVSKRLENLIERKKTNLTVSIDVTTQSDFFKILEPISEDILMVKTHIDILSDFDFGFIDKLKQLSMEKDFVIFEDRKFADIGNTVYHQYNNGIFNISDWADAVTIHLVAGDGTLKGIFKDNPTNKSSFLLAKMSSKDNLMDSTYTKSVFEIGASYPEFVSGFIGHDKTLAGLKLLKREMPKGFLLLTPGVSLSSSGDDLGQQYITAKTAILGGSDIIIVGRGICNHSNPKQSAIEYKEQAWEAWKEKQEKD
jgi:uridine monophosphate synthetase